ncbi:MAG: hypothetical protein BGO55_13375 [Sphingobacteriales bacterium 50-39]|nr:GNAT family N-acetyltransferase [Sphingobacteriales bacterium]OJW57290.1 MAG: hypothetical protein BGO55_13375 [Sphingobacteriales bacterium 50-39]
MSLYTLSHSDTLPALHEVQGLHIEESTDLTLLARMSNTPVSRIIDRLANDHAAFVAFVYGMPAAFGWMARGKARIGELNHELILPLRNRYLWNFRTAPAYRGQGIYPALLQYIVHHEREKGDQFWIIHAPENKSSLKGIVKAGFRNVGKLYLDRELEVTLRPASVTGQEKRFIEELGFRISVEQGASCWSCYSPFLKTRPETCCCAETGSICTAS